MFDLQTHMGEALAAKTRSNSSSSDHPPVFEHREFLNFEIELFN